MLVFVYVCACVHGSECVLRLNCIFYLFFLIYLLFPFYTSFSFTFTSSNQFLLPISFSSVPFSFSLARNSQSKRLLALSSAVFFSSFYTYLATIYLFFCLFVLLHRKHRPYSPRACTEARRDCLYSNNGDPVRRLGPTSLIKQRNASFEPLFPTAETLFLVLCIVSF